MGLPVVDPRVEARELFAHMCNLWNLPVDVPCCNNIVNARGYCMHDLSTDVVPRYRPPNTVQLRQILQSCHCVDVADLVAALPVNGVGVPSTSETQLIAAFTEFLKRLCHASGLTWIQRKVPNATFEYILIDGEAPAWFRRSVLGCQCDLEAVPDRSHSPHCTYSSEHDGSEFESDLASDGFSDEEIL
eukprot:GFYU01010510.1.p1 GENE.GFYU01010510.1~~GFYU01010510.1.p1  ORF type:complete len:188 (-),score=19.54 GFYU01010510.1:186-749(-)